MTFSLEISKVILMGCGATLVMDVWLMFLRRIGVPTLNFAFIGRWVGHLFRGKLAHVAIAKSPPIPGELALGWFTHYAVGVLFAGLLIGIGGMDWMANPTWAPAVGVGMTTVVVPLFVMQPAMGLGFAASKTPAPLKSCFRSVANHAVFGLGLYLSAEVIEWMAR